MSSSHKGSARTQYIRRETRRKRRVNSHHIRNRRYYLLEA